MKIIIHKLCGNFAENKDIARKIREEKIKPSISAKDFPIILDFESIDSSTQSFIHALISDTFQNNGEAALDFYEFRHCNEAVQSLIATVINYSIE